MCSRYLWDLLRVGMTITASDVPCWCNLLAGTDVSYLKLYVCTHKNTGSHRFNLLLLTTCYPIWSKTISFHNLQFIKTFFPGPIKRQSSKSLWLNLMSDAGEEHYTHRLCALWSPEVACICIVLVTQNVWMETQFKFSDTWYMYAVVISHPASCLSALLNLTQEYLVGLEDKLQPPSRKSARRTCMENPVQQLGLSSPKHQSSYAVCEAKRAVRVICTHRCFRTRAAVCAMSWLQSNAAERSGIEASPPRKCPLPSMLHFTGMQFIRTEEIKSW